MERTLRAAALPAEHGGWGLVAEPLVLALVLAPTRAAAAIAVASLAGFLLHHPLKLVLADARRRALYPRTRVALKVAAVYAAVAAAGLAAAVLLAGPSFLFALAGAAPLALIQLVHDARQQGRSLAAELCGAAALAATAPAALLAGGWTMTAAVVVSALLVARAAGSIIYIRARLRRDRGLGASVAGPLAVGALAFAAAAALAAWGHAPWTAPAAFAVLFARAAWGLSRWHAVVRPQAVGFQELFYGAATTALLAAGFLVR